jgi:dynein heavy chain
MPIDELPPLDSTQIKRILSSALNNKRLRGKRLDTAQLVKETNRDHARTMNRIVFDAHFRAAGGADLFASLELPPLPEPPRAPDFGTVAIPAHNFPEQFSEFAFHSFLTKSEVIGALVKVRAECNRVEGLALFNTFFGKSVRLDEFDQLQGQANAQVVNGLKEGWIATLKNAIRNSLREVGGMDG